MSKTVKLGSPARVWVITVRPILIWMVILQVWLFGGYIFVGTEQGLDWLIDNTPVRIVVLLFLLLPSTLFASYCLVLAFRAKRYQKRFKERRGLVCFVCDYDMLEDQLTCPECGQAVDMAKLGSRWKKMMEEPAESEDS